MNGRFEFTCSDCGGVAATLAVMPPGQGPWPPESASYELEFLGSNSGVASLALAEAVAGRDEIDPLVVRGFDEELGAFCCVVCEQNYCAKCWSTWIEFDEGFYDCTRGRCPSGHEQALDD